MRVLGIDIGYGSVKVIFGNDTGEPLKKFKFDSVIGITKANEYIKDQKIFRFKVMSVKMRKLFLQKI